MAEPNSLDVLVIGAGPAGLSVGAECAYHGLKDVVVLEKGPTHNQTVAQYYPDDKRVDAAYHGLEAVCAGVLCFRDTTKDHFLAVVEDLIRRFDCRIHYGKNADSIRKAADGFFHVSTSEGDLYRARFVVIAAGRMGKPNRPEYFDRIPPGARKQVQFDIRNLDAAGKRILVVGGGNSAIEFALSLATKGDVTVSYRKDTFSRLNPMNRALLEDDEKKGLVRILRSSNIDHVEERDGKPFVKFTDGGEEVFDHVIYGIGGSSPVAFLSSTGMQLNDKGHPILSPDLESSIPGLFVAGELSVPQGKGSIIVSFNSGKTVVQAIMDRLHRPRAPEIVSVTH